MGNKEFYFDGKTKLYIKLPEKFEEKRIAMMLSVPEALAGKYLTIQVASENSTIPVRARCNEVDCDDCHVVYCDVHQEYAELLNVENKSEEEDKGPTIPGHPNCHYGDCDKGCHVVSCAIYQGWEEVPEMPDEQEN